MRTLASLMDFSQSSLFFVFSLLFLIFHLLISILRRTVVHKIGAVTNTVAMLINTANTNYIETSLPSTSHWIRTRCLKFNLFLLSDEHNYTDVVYLMFCWPCIVIYPYNMNQQDALSIYFSNSHLHVHVSSRLTAHHQEVLPCIYSSWYMSCVYVRWLLAGSVCKST